MSQQSVESEVGGAVKRPAEDDAFTAQMAGKRRVLLPMEVAGFGRVMVPAFADDATAEAAMPQQVSVAGLSAAPAQPFVPTPFGPESVGRPIPGESPCLSHSI
jgi:hypothetical protein